jgi:hypothetical protein
VSVGDRLDGGDVGILVVGGGVGVGVGNRDGVGVIGGGVGLGIRISVGGTVGT